MTRPDPILVAECMAENRPRLLATIEAVKSAIPKDLSNPRKVQKP